MRVTVADNAPGEILQKLPDIVRHLMQLDAGALAGCSCGHDHDEPGLSKALKPGEPDPIEEQMRHPVTRAMYRAAKAAADAQGRALAADVSAFLAARGRP